MSFSYVCSSIRSKSTQLQKNDDVSDLETQEKIEKERNAFPCVFFFSKWILSSFHYILTNVAHTHLEHVFPDQNMSAFIVMNTIKLSHQSFHNLFTSISSPNPLDKYVLCVIIIVSEVAFLIMMEIKHTYEILWRKTWYQKTNKQTVFLTQINSYLSKVIRFLSSNL